MDFFSQIYENIEDKVKYFHGLQHCTLYQGRSHPQLVWASAQAQLQLSLLQVQPLLEFLVFPADLPADFWANSAGNTFLADFAMDLGSQVR